MHVVDTELAAHQALRRPPISQILLDVAADIDGPDISLADLMARLRGSAFGGLLLLIALLNMVPNLPGTSIIFGLLMLVPAVQLAMGRRALWLPKRLGSMSLSAERLRKVVDAVAPRLQRLEHWVRPRWSHLALPPWEQAIGIVLIALALLVALPIPLSNWVPAFAVLLVALGLIESDGLLIAIGLCLGVASAVIVGLIVGTALAAAGFLGVG